MGVGGLGNRAVNVAKGQGRMFLQRQTKRTL